VLSATYYDSPEFADQLMGEFRQWTLDRARDKLQLLRRFALIAPGMSALDVGCSSGAWLEVAAQEGAVATGIELGRRTAEGARSRGLDVITGTFAEAEDALRNRSFDLISFWDVLEHLRDPVTELVRATRYLTPGGVVAATFPNVEGLYPKVTYAAFARRFGIWEHAQLPTHLYDFSHSTAERLFAKAGIETIATRTLSVPFEFYQNTTLSRDRFGSGRRRYLRLCFEGLRFVVYPVARMLDKGNALFVAGRRQ
jgi:2-polyprenyl-3-methyl-5-hydroxy-6-metoxy-1,4-benzoquinol methylase